MKKAQKSEKIPKADKPNAIKKPAKEKKVKGEGKESKPRKKKIADKGKQYLDEELKAAEAETMEI